MSWFDDIFGQSKDNQKNEKPNNQNSSVDYEAENEPGTDEVYKRPKGKFRFPIQMEYEASDEEVNNQMHENTDDYEREQSDQRFYVEKEPSYSTNRRRRRRNQNSGQQSFNQQESKSNKGYRSNNNYSSYEPQSKANKRSSYKYQEDTDFNERLNSLHQPKFKASEVPSAIFGMRKQKDVPNSGLRDHHTSQESTRPDSEQSHVQKSETNNTNQNDTKQSVQEVPNYSKTDNTINIENIYASQIVSEIRKEREKKLQKKKQFEQALKEKREKERQNSTTPEEHSQVENQDYLLKQRASFIKQDPDERSNADDTTSEALNDQQEDVMSLQPDVNDLTTYEFKEINLDFEEETPVNQNESNEYEDVETSEITSEINEAYEETATSDDQFDIEDIELEEQPDEVTSNIDLTFEEEPTTEESVDEVETFEDTNSVNDTQQEETNIEEAEHVYENEHEVFDSQEQELTFYNDESDESSYNVEDVEVVEEVDEELDPELEQEQEAETVIESISNDEEKQAEVIDVSPEQVNEEQEVTSTEPISQEEVKPSLEPVLKPSGSRTSSPFNVVMTPSDKRKNQLFKKASSPQLKVNQSSTLDQEKESEETNEENETQPTKRKGPLYVLPPVSILDDVVEQEDNTEWLEEKKEELNEAFYHFNVPAKVVNMIQGPTVTRFELSVEKGVKVSRITALQDDIKMALAAKDIRIEAPIPGTNLVGIEVPNQDPKKIPLGQMITSKAFQQAESKLTVAMGFKINNEPLLMDIAKTPHALIAGATGSGKSVCINAILTSLLYKNHPDELKLLLIDPKMVELAPYNDLPHLVAPVITDVKAATASLKWAVEEMERRYKRFAELHVRNITAFNKKANYEQRMAKIIIVIDELADLMMMSPQEVEQSIARIAQKARACGIHMILATQRPSVNVITGLIKANVPTRISFMVSSSIDSRTILDVGGAEKLLGNGDMLYLGNGMNKPIRVQGAFVSDDEIDETVSNVSSQMKPNYLFKEESLLKKVNEQPADALFDDVCEFMVNEGHISTSLIQRHFQIGYNRAARMIDNLEERGFISGPNGSKPRDVLITKDMIEENETNI
ncbi:DNA translocase FtsK [Mammaliicoccus sp. Dog046]|uniref:DNA translocase FtsK n=1 Tax=Mammaliicoccus sp. Dog046 TaxID=3034233 RepID=UPI002B25F420|nr:DNA translocase FtsK [Mammaliicoccus sp. Dog046]WQK86415.1 DNA translocase FtsK [Mammaliicoccus sp. Dog046]